MNNKGGENGGVSIGFCGLLTLIFIVLKLLGIISWPWVWVLCPVWAPVVLAVVIAVIAWLIFHK